MAKGEITHIEFPADDPERAKRFYAAVAGWSFNEMPEGSGYWMFRTAPEAGGGIAKRGELVGNTLRIYITVDSLEPAIAAAEEQGGTVVTPPTAIEGMGRYAAVRDPEGNEVGLWENPST